MGHATAHYFLPHPPGEGSKSQISITKSISKIILPNFVCVLTNKTDQAGFAFCRLGHAPGCLGVKNSIFPNMVMWHIKLKGMVNRT